MSPASEHIPQLLLFRAPSSSYDLGQVLEGSCYLFVPWSSVPHKGLTHLNHVANLIPLLVLPAFGQHRYFKIKTRDLSCVSSVTY